MISRSQLARVDEVAKRFGLRARFVQTQDFESEDDEIIFEPDCNVTVQVGSLSPYFVVCIWDPVELSQKRWPMSRTLGARILKEIKNALEETGHRPV